METQQTFQSVDGGSIPTPPHNPKELKAEEISPVKAVRYNRIYHSRLPELDWTAITRTGRYVCYSFRAKGVWWAVGIWSAPVSRILRTKHETKYLELRRLAVHPKAPSNTPSRAMKVMRILIERKFPEVEKLISYQDLEYHEGIIYEADNWEKADNETKYREWNETRDRKPQQADSDKQRWEYEL